jgi:hypothetical protein
LCWCLPVQKILLKERETLRLLHDKINNTSLVIVVTSDNKSFFAFEKPEGSSLFTLRNDTLILDNHHYKIDGKGIDTSFSLKPLPAYQEFWHSWRTFNPGTQKILDSLIIIFSCSFSFILGA